MRNEYQRSEKLKQRLYHKKHCIDSWKKKCYRFIAFCLNGGLTDFTLTIEGLIDILNRTQNMSLVNELNEIIWNLINFTDLDVKSIDEPPKFYIPALNERSNFSFNEEVLCTCIKTGWLSKYLSENTKHFPVFIKLLLKKFCSNKLLNAINGHLKYINEQTGEEVTNVEERSTLSILISPLIEIFGDNRKSPITLTIIGKCLCNFVAKDSDKKNKIIMIQNDIVPKLAIIMDLFDYDEKLVIVALELLSLILPELKSKINEYLTDITGVNLLTNFKQMLKELKYLEHFTLKESLQKF